MRITQQPAGSDRRGHVIRAAAGDLGGHWDFPRPKKGHSLCQRRSLHEADFAPYETHFPQCTNGGFASKCAIILGSPARSLLITPLRSSQPGRRRM